ncbi:NPP1-domain-containing protein [Pseudovirgaria hyperparasitica]|uniref:NPP1-domain-containing protein n=1 Tax=Pseudovirgaria hyperparasitica TaxID=470096 RepID=A0A6A6W1E5_9PEZI|nr:NPP1-domain-containing protein [Pseudovirgaria hyperparasitica]KAF2756363.1 NPP1-domain-containing protein [Pseudovirgaria hyperparasitica]
MQVKTFVISALFASLTSAFPLTLESRAVIAHDAVVPFAQTVPSGTTGTLYLKYKPFLKIFNGCVPFPAVQANGDTGGGLATTGVSDGDCSSSTGQVYSRATSFAGRYAIMYSWYMPKDSPSSGLGHRHEWENIVVWLSAASETATTLSFAVSAHGNYDVSASPSYSGARPLVGYRSVFPVNHQMVFTSDVGGEQPLVAWESLTTAARTALTDTDFGDATVPFKDSTFTVNLQKAIDAEG